ncbi:MAG TPA: class III poly(R)-hydroxyalkanoic acid synthase subunit PhaE [Rudaea sp.]|nr:class III poly(R)-hydroxyalkanoic acid synthase subunit PhaE [Rudaea sp.]
MNGTKSPQDWMNDWQALQQQYWTAWSDATRGVVQPPTMNTPWQDGLEQWSKLFGNSGKQTETADRLISSAKNYVALMQSLLGAAAGKMPQGFAVPNWTDALRTGFNMPGMDATFRNNPFGKIFGDMRGPGLQGFGQLPPNFAPFLDQMKKEGLSWLHAPAFGFARERQEHYQKMAASFVEFQDALGRYNGLMLKSSQRSFEIFEGKLGEHDEPGRQIDSMRALYDVWVDAAEEAYAEIALSDEFRKVYGDVVNSQMRVRQAIQQEVERMSTDFGMPTRSELNSVHKRLHDLRREIRNGRSAESSKEIDELREEVRELKRAMAMREKAPAPPPPKPAATIPTPAPAKRARPPRTAAAARVVNPVEHIKATRSQKKRPSRKPVPKRATAERSHKRSASVHEHAPLSFADAINAMRLAAARKSGKRTSAAARMSIAVKSSKAVTRKRRRGARSR